MTVMPDSFPTLAVSTVADGMVGILTLSRPRAANAINTAMAQDLLAFFSDLVSDQQGWRCLVVTGAGKAFCAGGDLKERSYMDDPEWRTHHRLVERAILMMLDCPIPVIGAVNGAAYGGGCELALNMDFAYAAQSAAFALTEASLGIIPGAGGTQNLPRAVGARRAKELIFSASVFSAAEALAWGVVNRVLPDEELLDATTTIAGRIASNGPLAVRQAKKAIDFGLDMDKRSGLTFAVEAYDRLVATADRREGVRAFLEKRRPRFGGS